jgi:RHS repeat-associated protein
LHQIIQNDLLNRLTEISNKNSSADIINQHVFTYNNQDLRGSETISGSALPAMPSLPEETREYAYNTVNQLLSVTNPNLTFVYDDDGNMTQGYVGCSPLEGGVGGCSPFTATYDAEDRMTSLEYTDSSSVVHRTEYRYSGDGFLAEIKKYENSALVDTVRIVRDGLLAVQDRDGSNNVLREYTWGLNLGGGIGGLLNLKQGGQDYAYLYDGKGNVAAVLDASQAVVAAYRYAPFGKLLAKTGTLEQPFGFSTKRYDPDTGLVYYGHRYYSPAIGRWTTRDPLGEAGGMNLYAFVGNSPVNWVDPFGLQVQAYQVGTFDTLQGLSQVGDDLAIHHAVQQHPAGQIISGYSSNTGPAIAVPHGEHGAIPNIRGTYSGTARDLLARDTKNLRKYTNAPNSSLKELIKLNKQKYPKSFTKLPRKTTIMKGLGKTLVIVGILSSVLDVIDAKIRADENGIGVWTQMYVDYYESLGGTVIYLKAPGTI